MPDKIAQPDRKQHPDGVHRDQYDRPIIIVPGDEHATKCTLCQAQVEGWPYTRVTKFISVLDDEFLLKRWMKRQVLRGAVLRSDLVLKASAAIDDDDQLNSIAQDLVEAAKVVAPTKTPERGQAVHALTELIDRGETPAIPSDVAPDLEAYKQAIEASGMSFDATEVTVVIDGLSPSKTSRGLSGRFDRTIRLPQPCPTCQGLRRIGDVKTGATLKFNANEIAMQLATYAAGNVYNAGTGERFPLQACSCVGYVIHVPAGKGETTLYLVDIATARRGLEVAYEVWQWRQLDKLLTPVEAAPRAVFADLEAPAHNPPKGAPEGRHVSSGPAAGPSPETNRGVAGEGPAHYVAPGEPDIFGLIDMAADRAALAALWETYGPNGSKQWAYAHELYAKRRLEQIEGTST